ncbi:MAG: hypothetical protein N2035_00455 [Chthoniobacterales bacterium]|nr:hypothetical protein [Chthoniobacterales bacterium]
MQLGKNFIIGTIIFSLASAVIGFLNQGKLNSKLEQIADLEKKHQSLTSELDETKSNLEKTQNELQAAKLARDDLQAKLNASETNLEQTKAKIPALEEEIKSLKEKLTTAENDLQAKDTRIAELEAERIGATQHASPSVSEQELNDLKAQVAEKETVIAKLREDLASARSRVEDLQIEIRNRSQNVMRQGLTGKILAVNQGWNFVVLDLGDKNGVIKNAEMIVKRGSEMIGKVRITSVEPSNSIADIVVNSVPRGLTIQPGDTVIYSSETN